MRIPIVLALFGTSLALAGQLGAPSTVGATLLEESPPSTAPATPCGTHEAGTLEPEVLAACLAPELPPVKQPLGGDSSAFPGAREGAPRALAAPDPATLVRASSPAEPIAPRVPPYRVEDSHDDVRRFLDHFQTGYRRAVVERWLVRAGRYLPMLLDVFKQKGLPEELVFTAMIESGFDPLAVSRAGAKGLWQFMAPTARRYGLRVDNWLDERLDPEKSTVAAARHFLDLYAVFGSWNLAQAAYNAGERTVLEAIRAMGTSDFWTLARGRRLKEETKNFVPAIQAAALIAREPERYGFVVTPAQPMRYEVVMVPRATSLKILALRASLDPDGLERLNPELRLKQTPPDGPYPLKVPVGNATSVKAALDREAAALAPAGVARRQGHAGTGGGKPGIHVVRPLETVAAIARRYGVSVADIVRWNNLDGAAHIYPGNRLRVASAGPEEAPGPPK